MVDRLSNGLINYLAKGNYLKEDKEIYLYGAKLIISEGVGTLALLIIGLVTGCIVEALIYEVILSASRTVIGGYHCKSYWGCNCLYLGMFIPGVVLLNTFHFSTIVGAIILVLGSLAIWFLAPVEHINKTVSVEKKKRFCLYSRALMIIYLVIVALLYNFNVHFFEWIVYIYGVITILVVGGKLEYEKSKR